MYRALLVSSILIALAVPGLAQETSRLPETLIVAAQAKDLDEDHYLWAAEMVAARLDGDFEVLSGGLAAGLRFSRENPGQIQGILEVMIDVHTAFEEVRITCYDSAGREQWKKKTELNLGGSEERMARNMLDRVIKKIEKRGLQCR